MADQPRYALYTRISKDPTGTSTAPERQARECRRLAKERGIKIVEVYSDVDLSAYREVVRPQYEEMLAAMAEGAFDGVMVWKLDRLMRRIVEFSRFWKIASDNGVDLISKNDPVDTTSPIGVGIVHLIVALAEQESANTSMRIKAKEREMAEAGTSKAAGKRAYGLEKGWKKIVPKEARVIQNLAERLLAGESISSLVLDLNERNVPAAAGGRWTRRSVVVLMRQARLFGWREHKGELVAQGTWPVILDEATGLKLRQLLDPATGKGGTYNKRRYLMSGLLRCEKCGSRMKAGMSPRQGRRYSCPPKTEGGCSGTSIDQLATDAAVAAMVLHRLDSPNVRSMLRARGTKKRTGDDVEILSGLAALTERTDELAAGFAKGELPMAAFKAAQRAIEAQSVALNERLALIRQVEPLSKLSGSAKDMRAAWEGMSTDRRRAVIEALVEKVVVHGTTSPWFRVRVRESFLEEAADAEATGDRLLAKRRRAQAASETSTGHTFRPERLEPIWRV